MFHGGQTTVHRETYNTKLFMKKGNEYVYIF